MNVYRIKQTSPSSFYIQRRNPEVSCKEAWLDLNVDGHIAEIGEIGEYGFHYYTLEAAKKRAQHFMDNLETYPIYHNL